MEEQKTNASYDAGNAERIEKGIRMQRMTIRIVIIALFVMDIFLIVLPGICDNISRVFAADTSQSYSFSMSADSGDGDTAKVAAGDTVTVRVELSRTDAEGDYTVYAIQDDIIYDTEYFELDEDSITTGGAASGTSKGIRASTRSSSISGYNQITASAVQATGKTWSNPTEVMTFKLKALKSGKSTIRSTQCIVSNESASQSYTVTSNELTVTITAASSGGTEKDQSDTDDQEKTDGDDGDSGTSDGDSDTSGGDSGDSGDTDSGTGTDDSDSGSGDAGSGSSESGSGGTASTPDKGEKSAFTDINGHWAEEYINYAVSKGYFSGITENTFAPDENITRGMLVTVLWRKNGSPAAAGAGTSFSDVEQGSWYADAVNWAASEGIVSGYGDGRFGPDDPVTREQMLVIFSGCAAYAGTAVRAEGDLSGFTDESSVSVWARDAVSWGVGTGILNGVGDSRLQPGGTATRAQVAKILSECDEKNIM